MRRLVVPMLAALAVSCAPPAVADPAQDMAAQYGLQICKSLDETPTIDGVLKAGVDLTQKTGVTPYKAGEVIAYSAVYFCPRHIALLKRFVDYYKGGRQL